MAGAEIRHDPVLKPIAVGFGDPNGTILIRIGGVCNPAPRGRQTSRFPTHPDNPGAAGTAIPAAIIRIAGPIGPH